MHAPADKAALRTALLAARGAMPPEERRRCDALIGQQVLAWWRAFSSEYLANRAHQSDAAGPGDANVLGVYWPIRGEPNLIPTYEALSRLGAQLALPVVAANHAPLRFAAWSPGDALVKDALGVAIPAPPQRLVQPHALLIPCVGFTPARQRLGYGGGFYDRTLAAPGHPLAIGIAYAILQTAFEPAPHDATLDLVLTDVGCYG